MNYLKETNRPMMTTNATLMDEDDSNNQVESYKFVLIDKQNSRLTGMKNKHSQAAAASKQLGVNLNSTNKETLSSNPNIANPKDLADADPDRLNRLKRRIFWTKSSISSNTAKSINSTNASSSNSTNYLSSLTIDSTESVKTSGDGTVDSSSSSKKLNPPLNLTSRSSSMHHVSATTSIATATESSSSYSTHTSSLSMAASTLKPLFYNKLKRSSSHLFGVKLEKICGVHSATNNQLPAQIMNLLEKVAAEGVCSLMLFRKSASAKHKKVFKEKLDANQSVDYKDMNVHIAALLIKEYLREYPDGVIDYHIFDECMAVLKIGDMQQKLKTTKNLINRLPKWNQVCLNHFFSLFHLVSMYSHVNKMDMHNIAVCVAPSIFHKLDRPHDVESSFRTIAFIEHLIENTSTLFDDNASVYQHLKTLAGAPVPPSTPSTAATTTNLKPQPSIKKADKTTNATASAIQQHSKQHQHNHISKSVENLAAAAAVSQLSKQKQQKQGSKKSVNSSTSTHSINRKDLLAGYRVFNNLVKGASSSSSHGTRRNPSTNSTKSSLIAPKIFKSKAAAAAAAAAANVVQLSGGVAAANMQIAEGSNSSSNPSLTNYRKKSGADTFTFDHELASSIAAATSAVANPTNAIGVRLMSNVVEDSSSEALTVATTVTSKNNEPELAVVVKMEEEEQQKQPTKLGGGEKRRRTYTNDNSHQHHIDQQVESNSNDGMTTMSGLAAEHCCLYEDIVNDALEEEVVSRRQKMAKKQACALTVSDSEEDLNDENSEDELLLDEEIDIDFDIYDREFEFDADEDESDGEQHHGVGRSKKPPRTGVFKLKQISETGKINNNVNNKDNNNEKKKQSLLSVQKKQKQNQLKNSGSRHDLSSNTLSLDSGLSVPNTATTSGGGTATTTTTGTTTTTSASSASSQHTNSDPESDKSSTAASARSETEESTNVTTATSTAASSSVVNGHYLKRQKRMLALNHNNHNREQQSMADAADAMAKSEMSSTLAVNSLSTSSSTSTSSGSGKRRAPLLGCLIVKQQLTGPSLHASNNNNNNKSNYSNNYNSYIPSPPLPTININIQIDNETVSTLDSGHNNSLNSANDFPVIATAANSKRRLSSLSKPMAPLAPCALLSSTTASNTDHEINKSSSLAITTTTVVNEQSTILCGSHLRKNSTRKRIAPTVADLLRQQQSILIQQQLTNDSEPTSLFSNTSSINMTSPCKENRAESDNNNTIDEEENLASMRSASNSPKTRPSEQQLPVVFTSVDSSPLKLDKEEELASASLAIISTTTATKSTITDDLCSARTINNIENNTVNNTTQTTANSLHIGRRKSRSSGKSIVRINFDKTLTLLASTSTFSPSQQQQRQLVDYTTLTNCCGVVNGIGTVDMNMQATGICSPSSTTSNEEAIQHKITTKTNSPVTNSNSCTNLRKSSTVYVSFTAHIKSSPQTAISSLMTPTTAHAASSSAEPVTPKSSRAASSTSMSPMSTSSVSASSASTTSSGGGETQPSKRYIVNVKRSLSLKNDISSSSPQQRLLIQQNLSTTPIGNLSGQHQLRKQQPLLNRFISKVYSNVDATTTASSFPSAEATSVVLPTKPMPSLPKNRPMKAVVEQNTFMFRKSSLEQSTSNRASIDANLIALFSNSHAASMSLSKMDNNNNNTATSDVVSSGALKSGSVKNLDIDLAEVTWSVPHIRRQFEANVNATATAYESSKRMSRFIQQQPPYILRVNTMNSTSAATDSVNSDDTSSNGSGGPSRASSYRVFNDINGNPTTSI